MASNRPKPAPERFVLPAVLELPQALSNTPEYLLGNVFRVRFLQLKTPSPSINQRRVYVAQSLPSPFLISQDSSQQSGGRSPAMGFVLWFRQRLHALLNRERSSNAEFIAISAPKQLSELSFSPSPQIAACCPSQLRITTQTIGTTKRLPGGAFPANITWDQSF